MTNTDRVIDDIELKARRRARELFAARYPPGSPGPESKLCYVDLYLEALTEVIDQGRRKADPNY